MASDEFRLVTVPGGVVESLPGTLLEDVAAYYDPDAFAITHGGEGSAAYLEAVTGVETLRTDESVRPQRHELEGGSIVVVGDGSEAGPEMFRPEDPAVIVSTELSRGYNFRDFEYYSQGLRSYRELIGSVPQESVTAHLSAGLQAKQLLPKAEPLRVHGAAHVEGTQQSSDSHLPLLRIRSDGSEHSVSTELLGTKNLGVEAIRGLGRKMRVELSKAGFSSIEELADATVADLSSVHGIQQRRARSFISQARSEVSGDVVRFGEMPVDPADLLYIDIETDHTDPDNVWLICVFDRRESYAITFSDRPDEPGAVQAFGNWLRETENRPLCAWFGRDFDFPVLESFLHDRGDADVLASWEARTKVDAVTDLIEPHGSVPSRSRALDSVARRMGVSVPMGRKTGRQAARAYTAHRVGESQLDWELWEEYCQEDCRLLSEIVNQFANAPTTVLGNEVPSRNINRGQQVDLTGEAVIDTSSDRTAPERPQESASLATTEGDIGVTEMPETEAQATQRERQEGSEPAADAVESGNQQFDDSHTPFMQEDSEDA